MTVWLHGGAVLLYAAAAVLLGIALAQSSRRLPGYATWLTAVAALLHAAALFIYWSQWGQLPLSGLGPVLSCLALLIAFGALGLASLGRARPVGLVLTPVVAVMVAVSLAAGLEPSGTAVNVRDAGFVLHVMFAFLGYVGLTVAFAAGLMYLLQFRELKGKHFGAVFRFFPPLRTLDRIGGMALAAGFPALTLALVVGWVWSLSALGAPATRNPDMIWGVLTWIIFAVALGVRAGSGRAAYRGALASVIGFTVVVLAYLVLRFQLSEGGVFL